MAALMAGVPSSGWATATATANANANANANAHAHATTPNRPTGLDPLPRFEQVRAAHRPSDLVVLDRHGQPLQWQRIDDTVRRGPWLSLAQVSPALVEALVLGEDRRFWEHGGVDWPALAAGAWARLRGGPVRGASTLSMQLAALLDDDLSRPAGGRGARDKWAQLRRAQALEARWTKAQILEAYLNHVPLRGEIVGLGAAAPLLFGKHASGLDAFESALLVAWVRAPNAAEPAVRRRACELLRAQARDCAPLADVAARAFARRPGALTPPGAEALAPHFARRLLAALPPQALDAAALSGGVPSTLDARWQRLATQALRQQLGELRGHGVRDGAVLVLDNARGEVLAWVGSAGPGAQAPAVDAVLARRQAGSTLKPFVYALALEQHLITAASVLDDAPLQLAAGAALYRPRNYDGGFRGPVRVREALAASLNVPAVQVGAMLGPDAVFARLQVLGFDLRESGGWHGHALVLGSADVTLLGLAEAYRTLARGGVAGPLRLHAPAQAQAPTVMPKTGPAHAHAHPDGKGKPNGNGSGSGSGSSSSSGSGDANGNGNFPSTTAPLAVDPTEVDGAVPLIDPAVAWLVADMLADPAARAPTFGLDSPLVTRGWAAVKTGTSKDMRDNWCVGFSERYTVAVWVGNADGAPMHGVSGTEGAAPVWRALMLALHADTPSRAPPPPPGLQRLAGEWFLPGTEPGAWGQQSHARHAAGGNGGGAAAPGNAPGPATLVGPSDPIRPFGISHPREGSVILLDPEIPPATQRLRLAGASGQWWLGGRQLGRGERIDWLPQPGRHTLELRDGEGRVLDRVRFEVRAAAPRR